MSTVPFAHDSFFFSLLLFQTKTFLLPQSHQNWVLSRASRSFTSVSNHATFPAFIFIPAFLAHFIAAFKYQLTTNWRALFRLTLESVFLFKNLHCVSNGCWYCASIIFAVLLLIFTRLYLLRQRTTNWTAMLLQSWAVLLIWKTSISATTKWADRFRLNIVLYLCCSIWVWEVPSSLETSTPSSAIGMNCLSWQIWSRWKRTVWSPSLPAAAAQFAATMLVPIPTTLALNKIIKNNVTAFSSCPRALLCSWWSWLMKN